MRAPRLAAATAALLGASALFSAGVQSSSQRSGAATPPQLFETADRCQACHNQLMTPAGEDVSIGVEWRASMMAHSARDPYWHAGVRREVLDHPAAAAAIEHECSRCHMPMAHVTAVAAGGRGSVFARLQDPQASDGVSCSLCHQIGPETLGTRASFTGHFVVDTATPPGARAMFGPFAPGTGLDGVMQSATGFTPTESTHIQSSEVCATCHTLYTQALGSDGQAIGELPEQVPYLEWRHSAFRETASCQSCHMPTITDAVRVSSALGEPRQDVSRHTFRGANFWMLRVFNRYRDELGITIPSSEISLALQDTLDQLAGDTATVAIERAERIAGQLALEVRVRNLTGHKLPTAYPSRRAWLHVTVRDAAGAVRFESGAVAPDGSIAGNDNDVDPGAFEPHYERITRADQVQIYEDIMADAQGVITTGLLSAVRYVKDNRLLPAGFDKVTAAADIAVHGQAATDADFVGGSDRIRYDIPVTSAGRIAVQVELLYQTVGFRWADNLRRTRAPETDRFVRYFEALSGSATARLAVTAVEELDDSGAPPPSRSR